MNPISVVRLKHKIEICTLCSSVTFVNTMFFLPGGCLIQACAVGMNCMAQACCWYQVFRCCGCVKKNNHMKLQEPKPLRPPPVPEPTVITRPKIVVPTPYNPFLATTGVPKDIHLQPAYDNI